MPILSVLVILIVAVVLIALVRTLIAEPKIQTIFCLLIGLFLGLWLLGVLFGPLDFPVIRRI